ncbi:MAG: ABC transporter substrate binding protein, partial [Chloroflexota bacterium]|nr:ABC transporter substrate binding protein [Chloroflexota bacterium]
NEFEALKSTILEYQDQADATVLFLPWTIEDANGDHAPQDQVVRWFLQNSSRPSIGFLDILVEEGYLCGVVVDMNRQGFYAGLLGGRILNGESPAEIPIIDPVANRILINLARADQLGIEIPFEVLQDADEVFQEMTVYPEYQMSE